MSTSRRVAAIAVAIATAAVGVMIQRVAAGASTTELVTNGGFEMPVLATGTYSITASIPHWTEMAPRTCGIEVQNHVAGSPFEGRQFTELDSNCSTGIFQDLATMPGHVYRLSCEFSARPGRGPADNILQTWWNGRLIDTEQADGTGLTNTKWTRFSFTVKATGTSTRVAFSDAGVSNGYGTYLDDVSVRAVHSENDDD